MKKLLLLIFSLTFFLSISQVPFIQRAITLNDEEDFVAPVYSDSTFDYYHDKEDSIADVFIDRLDRSPLVSTVMDDSMFVCLAQAIDRNCTWAYTDKRFSPVLWSTGNVYTELIVCQKLLMGII